MKLADLIEATWTLPPPESLYGGVVAEAFCSEGLEVPRATVFTSVTAVRNALLATGRFLSIVQGSVVRFSVLAPQFKALPIALPTTRRPLAAITLKGGHSARPRGCSSIGHAGSPDSSLEENSFRSSTV
jgi:DNA-binding transcriptional LysR family regulator